MHKIQAIVSGIIRSDLESQLVFHQLITQRHAGVLERVIFVSWDDHLDNHKDLVKFLTENGIDVLPVPMPVAMPHVGSTRANIQTVPIYKALSFFDDDALVLRVRLDKCFPLLRTFFARPQELAARCLQTEEGSILESKVMVAAMNLSVPFEHFDYLMLAKASVFRRLINFDTYFDMFCSATNGNIRWFSHPFIKHYPDIRTFFEGVNVYDFSRAVHAWITRSQDPLPEPINRLLARYYDICRRHFFLMNDTPLPEPLSLRDALAGNDQTACNWMPQVLITTNAWLDRFAKGEGCSEFSEAIELCASGRAARQTVFPEDMTAIRTFIDTALNQTQDTTWQGIVSCQRPLIHARTPSLPPPSLRQSVVFLAKQIMPDFEPAKVEGILSVLLDRFDNYPPGHWGQFSDIASVIANSLGFGQTSVYGKKIPPEAYLIRALLSSLVIVFNHSSRDETWLAQALLENKIPAHFAEVARWGLLTRQDELDPYAFFLAGLLLIQGIGGKVDRDEGLRLIDKAATSGDRCARAYLDALTKLERRDQGESPPHSGK